MVFSVGRGLHAEKCGLHSRKVVSGREVWVFTSAVRSQKLAVLAGLAGACRDSWGIPSRPGGQGAGGQEGNPDEQL